MAADVDENPTPIACDACDGDKDRRVGCNVCGGAGSISAEKRRSRSRDRLRRVSGSHLGFASEAGAVSSKLEELAKARALSRANRDALEASELAQEGRKLERAFASWTETPPEDEDRVATISALLDWNRRARDLLAASGTV
jgi:hypothetical protein